MHFVLAMMPLQRQDRYNAIKKLLCCEQATPSQVVLTKTLSDDRKFRSVVQKIALQINCKMGGELWAVNIPSV